MRKRRKRGAKAGQYDFINRPTVSEYINLHDDDKEFVDFVIDNGLKPNKTLRVKRKKINPRKEDFWKLTWSEIIELRNEISENNITEIFKIVYGINEKQFLKLDVFNCFAAYKWIAEQLKNISEIEKQELGGELTQDEKNAGVEELSRFSYAVYLKKIARTPSERAEWLNESYSIVFREMCIDKTYSDIQKRHIENARRKIKTNS